MDNQPEKCVDLGGSIAYLISDSMYALRSIVGPHTYNTTQYFTLGCFQASSHSRPQPVHGRCPTLLLPPDEPVWQAYQHAGPVGRGQPGAGEPALHAGDGDVRGLAPAHHRHHGGCLAGFPLGHAVPSWSVSSVFFRNLANWADFNGVYFSSL